MPDAAMGALSLDLQSCMQLGAREKTAKQPRTFGLYDMKNSSQGRNLLVRDAELGRMWKGLREGMGG